MKLFFLYSLFLLSSCCHKQPNQKELVFKKETIEFKEVEPVEFKEAEPKKIYTLTEMLKYHDKESQKKFLSSTLIA